MNIKSQKDYLNMNPACSACLLSEWMVQTQMKKRNQEKFKWKQNEFGQKNLMEFGKK